MYTANKKIFLAAVLCALAVPALPQNTARNNDPGSAVVAPGPRQTEGEAANLEKKETGVDTEALPVRHDHAGKRPAASAHNARLAATHSIHPKAAVVQRAATPQHGTAKLQTSQLTSGRSAKLQTRQTTLHRAVDPDREEDGGQLSAGEETKVNHQQNKPSNEIHQKKHNARMF